MGTTLSGWADDNPCLSSNAKNKPETIKPITDMPVEEAVAGPHVRPSKTQKLNQKYPKKSDPRKTQKIVMKAEKARELMRSKIEEIEHKQNSNGKGKDGEGAKQDNTAKKIDKSGVEKQSNLKTTKEVIDDYMKMNPMELPADSTPSVRPGEYHSGTLFGDIPSQNLETLNNGSPELIIGFKIPVRKAQAKALEAAEDSKGIDSLPSTPREELAKKFESQKEINIVKHKQRPKEETPSVSVAEEEDGGSALPSPYCTHTSLSNLKGRSVNLLPNLPSIPELPTMSQEMSSHQQQPLEVVAHVVPPILEKSTLASIPSQTLPSPNPSPLHDPLTLKSLSSLNTAELSRLANIYRTDKNINDKIIAIMEEIENKGLFKRMCAHIDYSFVRKLLVLLKYDELSVFDRIEAEIGKREFVFAKATEICFFGKEYFVFGLDTQNRLVIGINVSQYKKSSNGEDNIYLFLYSLIFLNMHDFISSLKLQNQISFLLDFKDTTVDPVLIRTLISFTTSSFPDYLKRIYVLNADLLSLSQQKELLGYFRSEDAKKYVAILPEDYDNPLFREVQRTTVAESYGGLLSQFLFDVRPLLIEALRKVKILQ